MRKFAKFIYRFKEVFLLLALASGGHYLYQYLS